MINKIFLDMDGVITDFIPAIIDYYDMECKPEDIRTWDGLHDYYVGTKEELWDNLPDDFWTYNMPWTPWAEELLDMIKLYNPIVLSMPPENGVGATGKIQWIRNNMPDYYKEDRWVITRDKTLLAARGNVLIDDAPHNIYSWERAGGYGILVPAPWNLRRGEDVIKRVEKMLYFYRTVGKEYEDQGRRQ